MFLNKIFDLPEAEIEEYLPKYLIQLTKSKVLDEKSMA